MSGTRFMVQWEEHPSHLASRLGQLLEHQTLVDVTLMCNTHTLKVHRAVLAACSPYFETLLQSIFQRQLGQHPLIVLKDMQFSVLKSLIEFMYCGETNVTEDDLGALLQAARFFQVKGLSSMSREALGIPVPKSKSTINGDTTKSTNKTRTLETESKVFCQSPVDHNQAAPEDPTTNEKLVSRPGPEASADTAQVLLSLSGEIDSIRANSKEEEKVAAEDAAMAVAKAQEEEEAAASAEVANAVHSANPTTTTPVSHSPQVPPGGYPIYVPGPRKRGRPLKRQMNLIFQEKVMTDAEMALRKEAEASRKALEALQKEMSARDGPASEAPTNVGMTGRPRGARNVVQQRVQQVAQLGQTRQIAQVRDRTNNPGSGNVMSSTSANSSTNATAAVANVSNSTAGGTVMTQYMEVLKEAGLPTDVPILMDSGDGSFVTVNEEVLMNIVSGGVIQCHVEEGGNIATLTTGDGGVVTTEVHEDPADGANQVVEAQNDMGNADHIELTGMVATEGTTQGEVRGQDMPSVDADEGVGATNIAFSENETVVQEVEGKENEGGDTIYMVVEDGSGTVEGQQVIDHDGVPLCKVKAETVEGKTMYLVTRDATKTMQCAISEGALVVSEGDVVQGISLASDVELQRNKASLVKKVEYGKIGQLPSLDDSDIAIQGSVVPSSQEEKAAEGNVDNHPSESSKTSEEVVSVVSSDAVAESQVSYSAAALPHSTETENTQSSVECQQFVTSIASASSDVSNKRSATEDAMPMLNKRLKMENQEEEEELVLVLKDEEMEESSSNAGEKQAEFLLASSGSADSASIKREGLQNTISSAVPVGDFQGKVELATGPRREGRSLPMLQDSDDDVKSSTM